MECLLSFIKEWGALLLSSLGICGGFFAYLRHDRKIKEQELRLNELQIKQFEKEEAAENGGYPPTQNGDIRSLFWLFSLMALQN